MCAAADSPRPLIYDALAGEHLTDPLQPGTAAGHLDYPMPGEDDDLIEHTDNGLRPADLELPQPPQDPRWRPDDTHR